MRAGRNFISIAGLLVGTIFFALSLTPSLIPRSDITQGFISGLSLTAGYGLGVFFIWLWRWLGLPVPSDKVRWTLKLAAAGFSAVLALVYLWNASNWQNSIRDAMGMEEVSSVRPFTVALVALLLFLLLLILAKLFRLTYVFLSRKLEYRIPRRVSLFVGLVAAFGIFWALIDDVLLSAALHTADSTYKALDAHIEPDLPAPSDPRKPGGANSLLHWQDMGHQGRRYLALGPSGADISEVSDGAMDPIRVYVGLNAADTPKARAKLALDELIRVGGFNRSVLILITPTGTGWIDPGGINSVEYLFKGDISSVAAQYSYLPSPIALMTQGAYGVETAQALFRAIYGYWRELPKEVRPKLYLFGLSLGALNSDRSFDFYDIIDLPFHGALWTGPPFRSDTWRKVTAHRDAGSPAWLPVFRGGAVVRFGNQYGGYQKGDAPWGSFRLAYLQHASDPIVFFEPQAAYRKPAWINEPRGRDVTPKLSWYPIVTMLQLAADMHAGSAPEGFGHSYAPAEYLDAWMALTEPDGWSEEQLQRLRKVVSAKNKK